MGPPIALRVELRVEGSGFRGLSFRVEGFGLVLG